MHLGCNPIARSDMSILSLIQFTKFGLIGVIANAVYFGLYVLLTASGLPPLPAAATVFVIGSLNTFWLNKRITFGDRNPPMNQLMKYLLLYFVAGVLNLVILDHLISYWAMNHVIAQGILVCFFAVLLFVVQKHLVFRRN